VNLRLALRTLLKSPYVIVVGVVSLAFGIGVTTAIFSLYYQLLLRPLPVRNPGELVNLSSPGPRAGNESCGDQGGCESVFSYPMFRDLEREQSPFTGIAGHVTFGANLATNGAPMSGNGMLVSGSYFELLGLQPALGRLLGRQDDGAPGASTAVVLSYDYWRSQFAGDQSVLNKALTVNGCSLTIVGVTPQGFTGTSVHIRPQFFVPLTLRDRMQPGSGGPELFENRQSHWIYLFARLKPGIDMESARLAINTAFHNIITEVEAPAIGGFSPQNMERFRARQLFLEGGRHGQSVVRKNSQAPLRLLFAVTGAVLLIVCLNLANLLLIQSVGRSTEIAIRTSIGATRMQLAQQLLTESFLLAAIGGIGGLAVARWTLGVVLSIFPESTQYFDYGIQPAMLVFAAAITFACGIAFGLIPALQATRPDLFSRLRTHTAQAPGSRFRTGLATIQIAFSLILLVSAGLFAKSLHNVSRVDLGLRVENLVVFGVSPVLNGYPSERSRALFERLEEDLRSLPGVTGVAAARVGILAGHNWGNDVTVEGFDGGPDADRHSNRNMISPNFFSTLGMRLKAGRDFKPADNLDQPRVAIVNEAFARKFNLGTNPVGKRMKIGGADGPLNIEIVGLAHDAKYSTVKQEVPPVFFIPYRQTQQGIIHFYVRTARDHAAVIPEIERLMKRIDPNLPVEGAQPLAQQARESSAIDQLLGVLSSAFAFLATLIAGVGLYGVLAFTVVQRTREIGLRIAVGARPEQIQWMFFRQVGKIMLFGGIIGVAGAAGMGRLADSLLFEINGNDPAVMLASALFLTLVVLAASFVPAYRASKVHPMEALRHE
jgi:predicted permease